MSCNLEVLQFTLSPQTNLLKIHCRRFLHSHSRIKLKSTLMAELEYNAQYRGTYQPNQRADLFELEHECH